jgi:FeS assembly SUF system regulator
MFKISRLTDYSVVLLRFLAAQEGAASARDLSRASGLPLPTVSKLLKLMAKNKIIRATRGVSGGYELILDPKAISVLTLIEVFEGPLALTACKSNAHQSCQIDNSCPQKDGWSHIHEKIAQLLRETSLSELIGAK